MLREVTGRFKNRTNRTGPDQIRPDKSRPDKRRPDNKRVKTRGKCGPVSRWFCLAGLSVVMLLCVSACSTAVSYPVAEESSTRYQRTVSNNKSRHGCYYKTVYRQPHQSTVSFTVVLGHGFLRSQRYLHNLAIAIASAGVPVATLDFCNMKPWNGHHRRNAADMIAVASQLQADKVLYAGFSAGALAAVLAGAGDDRVQGLLLLDYVDQPPIGREALSNVTVPVYAIVGRPSGCNADGRDHAVLSSLSGVSVKRYAEASHCAFESPTNWVCNRICRADQARDRQWRQSIIEHAVAAIDELSRTGSFPLSSDTE